MNPDVWEIVWVEDTKAVNQSVDSTVRTVAGKGESVDLDLRIIIWLPVIALFLR